MKKRTRAKLEQDKEFWVLSPSYKEIYEQFKHPK